MKNKQSQLIKAGREKVFTGKAVNPRLVRASTIVFDSVADMKQSVAARDAQVEYYGRRGTTTTFAFQQAMCEFESAAGCAVYPSGTSAITTALSAFLNPGDHLLIVDSAYEPTRDFCTHLLAERGVQVTFYDPLSVEDLAHKVRANTQVIFLESPGSLTMEVQDIASIVALAKKHDVVTMIDNTYATALNFAPLEVGIDVSIQSATKYICGHSDVMLGVCCANQATWPRLQKVSAQLGLCASVDDVYTALRGMRTLSVRMRQHDASARQVAEWLSHQAEVDHVRHPALSPCPGHAFYNRDTAGANGLFSFVMTDANVAAIDAMLDGYEHFKLGFSWGGYESLVLKATDFSAREFATIEPNQTVIRLHVGLEHVDDLIDDLARGFDRYRQAAAR